MDDLVRATVSLNYKFLRYAQRDANLRQQFETLKKEKEDLQFNLNDVLKQKENVEQQLVSLELRLQQQENFLLSKLSSENGTKPTENPNKKTEEMDQKKIGEDLEAGRDGKDSDKDRATLMERLPSLKEEPVEGTSAASGLDQK